jgi:DeoR family transcriptional regulator of aga operon
MRANNQRRQAIFEEIQRQRLVRVVDLSQALGVSEVSIRADLEYLERHGLARRVHGGAEAIRRYDMHTPFEARRLQNVAIKQAIARAASGLIEANQVLFLDSGTTVLEIARNIPETLLSNGGLTIITRSLAIAETLRSHRSVRLILLGGIYAHDYDTFIGSQVMDALQDIHADLLFAGTDGITLDFGVTTDNLLEKEIHQRMVTRADRIIVASDSSKIGVKNIQGVFPLEAMHTFITDTDAPMAFIESLGELGIQVITVSPNDNQE